MTCAWVCDVMNVLQVVLLVLMYLTVVPISSVRMPFDNGAVRTSPHPSSGTAVQDRILLVHRTKIGAEAPTARLGLNEYTHWAGLRIAPLLWRGGSPSRVKL